MAPTKVFLSHSPSEEHVLQRLRLHLAPLVDLDLISYWDESQPCAGDALEDARHAALSTASLVVVFLSPDYLASSLCARLLEHAATRDLPIIAVLARACTWELTPILVSSTLFPTTRCPLQPHADLDEALVALIQMIRGRLDGAGASATPVGTDYQYDLLISYRRRDPALGWVRHHLFPMLSQWLGETLGREPSICINLRGEDQDRLTKTDPSQPQLARTRCLLSIWSPGYFQAGACVSELVTMLEREHLTQQRLVYPVLFSDGEHIPERLGSHRLTERRPKDLREWNCPLPGFAAMRGGVELDRQIHRLAEELGALIGAAPQWAPGWPMANVGEQGAIHVPLLRIE